MSLTKLSLVGSIYLFPTRESLVSGIPAGEEKTANLFLQCRNKTKQSLVVLERPPIYHDVDLWESLLMETGDVGRGALLCMCESVY
jgi:hypothetical protein